MDACRILASGAVECDQTFTAVQEPGELVELHLVYDRTSRVAYPGDTLDGRALIDYGEDAHRNRITAAGVGALPDSLVSWTWTQALANRPELPIRGSGWMVTVPDFEAEGYTAFDIGSGTKYAAFLQLHFEGARAEGKTRYDAPVE
jgi:hypothetical protein